MRLLCHAKQILRKKLTGLPSSSIKEVSMLLIRVHVNFLKTSFQPVYFSFQGDGQNDSIYTPMSFF